MVMRDMKYAVVFKTYSWDAFIERQALRAERLAKGQQDFFISIDETNGPVGAVPFRNVLRTTNDDLIRMGLPHRWEMGSLLWWNADYIHYYFHNLFPDYDFYVFIEYDCIVTGELGSSFADAMGRGYDSVFLPIENAAQDWYWTDLHLQTYDRLVLKASLNCFSIFTKRALAVLKSRRIAMGSDRDVKYWPSGEVFVATEMHRAKLLALSLDEIGSIDAYKSFPPMLERDVEETRSPAFFHPVLDEKRYIASLLKTTAKLVDFVQPWSPLHRSLARFPYRDYLPFLAGAIVRRLRNSAKLRWQRAQLRLGLALGRRRDTITTESEYSTISNPISAN